METLHLGKYIQTEAFQGLLKIWSKFSTTISKFYEQGYRTRLVGKWHLGVGAKGEYLPTNFGFDSSLGIPYAHDECPCHMCFVDKPCHCPDEPDMVSCPLYRWVVSETREKLHQWLMSCRNVSSNTNLLSWTFPTFPRNLLNFGPTLPLWFSVTSKKSLLQLILGHFAVASCYTQN